LKTTICIFTLLFACTAGAQDPYSAVRRNLATGHVKRAASVIDSCALKGFHTDSAMYYGAIADLLLGKTREARKTTKRLGTHFPEFHEREYLTGLVYFHQEKYGKALDAFTSVLVRNPGHAKALHNRSLTYGLLDQYELALQDVENLLKLEPGNVQAHYSRGYWNEFLSKYAEAAASYEEALKRDPGNYDAYFGLAYVYGRLNDPAKACEAIKRAIAAGSQIAEDIRANYCR
jgi:tetratricopeptide (TPR) repeat protein